MSTTRRATPASKPKRKADKAREAKPIWERFAEAAAELPEEAWSRVPADASERLEHYLYGSGEDA